MGQRDELLSPGENQLSGFIHALERHDREGMTVERAGTGARRFVFVVLPELVAADRAVEDVDTLLAHIDRRDQDTRRRKTAGDGQGLVTAIGHALHI